MDTGDLTIQVLNLSPKVTCEELTTFFSYCGTVHTIQFLRDKDLLPYALVTFGQPYAFQTALLLDGAIFSGQPICILPAYVTYIPIVSDEDIDETQSKSQGFIPAAVYKTMQSRASKGVKMLKKSKDELEENLKLSEKGRMLVERKGSAIYAVEQAAGRMGTAIMNNNIVSIGATCFSRALDKASRSASDLGIRKRD